MSTHDHRPIGIQLNNPGCLRRACSPDSRTTLVDGYASFVSWHEGLENLAWCIWQFYNHHALITPRAFLSRYAPAKENDLLGYINFVCGWFGIDPRQDGVRDLMLDQPSQAVEMMKAISTKECGWKSTLQLPHQTWISNEDAYAALAIVGKWK